MEQAVLTPAQKIVVDGVVHEPKLGSFYLSGGTALAGYYLHHRESDDLDFFVQEQYDVVFMHAFVERLKGALHATEVRFEKLYDRNQFFFVMPEEELKVEFSLYPFKQLENPSVWGGLRVDSVRDITANKLMALVDRFDPKDFVDMFFLLQKFDVDAVRTDAEKKFGVTLSDMALGQEFAKVRRVEALPKMTKPLSVEELKSFFTKQAQKIRPSIIE
jgi:predicted nucleotidyltransferase component of viral defense system